MARKLIDIDALVGDPIEVQIGGVKYPVKDLDNTEYLRLVRLTQDAENSDSKTLASNEVMIEQAKTMLPSYPWDEKPMPILAIIAIVQAITTEMGEAMAGMLNVKAAPQRTRK
jgi:hypothetical protein